MNKIVGSDAVAAEGFITHVAFQVRIKNSILVINRAESAIGKIIVRVEIAAVACFWKSSRRKRWPITIRGAR